MIKDNRASIRQNDYRLQCSSKPLPNAVPRAWKESSQSDPRLTGHTQKSNVFIYTRIHWLSRIHRGSAVYIARNFITGAERRPVMVKKKTSVMLEEETWKAFTLYVVQRTASARKMSEAVEEALKNYMTDPRAYRNLEGESRTVLIDVGSPHIRKFLDRMAKEGYNTLLMRIWKK